MLVPRQQYPREFHSETLVELDSGKIVGEVARTYQVSPKRLETWRGEWRARGEQLAFPGHAAQSQAKVDGQRIPELERKIGQQAMEIDFLKKVLGGDRQGDAKSAGGFSDGRQGQHPNGLGVFLRRARPALQLRNGRSSGFRRVRIGCGGTRKNRVAPAFRI